MLAGKRGGERDKVRMLLVEGIGAVVISWGVGLCARGRGGEEARVGLRTVFLGPKVGLNMKPGALSLFFLFDFCFRTIPEFEGRSNGLSTRVEDGLPKSEDEVALGGVLGLEEVASNSWIEREKEEAVGSGCCC